MIHEYASKIVIACSLILACASSHKVEEPRQHWSGKVYVGSSSHFGIRRAQANETIKCTDPAFDEFICIHKVDWFDNYFRCSTNREGFR